MVFTLQETNLCFYGQLLQMMITGLNYGTSGSMLLISLTFHFHRYYKHNPRNKNGNRVTKEEHEYNHWIYTLWTDSSHIGWDGVVFHSAIVNCKRNVQTISNARNQWEPSFYNSSFCCNKTSDDSTNFLYNSLGTRAI